MTHYNILELNKFESDSAKIKTAYRRLARKYHPDKPGGTEEAFKKLDAAYTTLSAPKKKAAYDEQLRTQTRDEEKSRWHSFMATPETQNQQKEREQEREQKRKAREEQTQQRKEETTKNITNMISKVKVLFKPGIIVSFANRDMANYSLQYFNRIKLLTEYEQEDTTDLIEIIKAFSRADSSVEREALYTHLLMPLLGKLHQQPELARINFLNKQDTEGNTALLLLAELDSRLLPQKEAIISQLFQLGADPTIQNTQGHSADSQVSKDSITKFTFELAKVDDARVSEALATITKVVEDYIGNHLKSSLKYRPAVTVYNPKTSKVSGNSRTKEDCMYDYLEILRNEVVDEHDQRVELTDRQKLVRLKEKFQEDKPVLETKRYSGFTTFFGRVAEAFSNLFKSSEAKKLPTQGLANCGFFASHGERALKLSSDAIKECVQPLSPA